MILKIYIIQVLKYENPRKLKVNQYDLEWNFINTWNSITEAENKLNIYSVSSVCKWKRKTAGWYMWKYN